MDQEKLKHFKKLLEEKKLRLEKELSGFANKDSNLEGDYDTRFPNFGTEQSVDESAPEVAEYEATLPVEYALETELKNVNEALESIEKSTYGACVDCGEEIEQKRLEALPEAKTCLGCKNRV